MRKKFKELQVFAISAGFHHDSHILTLVSASLPWSVTGFYDCVTYRHIRTRWYWAASFFPATSRFSLRSRPLLFSQTERPYAGQKTAWVSGSTQVFRSKTNNIVFKFTTQEIQLSLSKTQNNDVKYQSRLTSLLSLGAICHHWRYHWEQQMLDHYQGYSCEENKENEIVKDWKKENQWQPSKMLSKNSFHFQSDTNDKENPISH